MTSTTELATSGSGSGTILKTDKRGRLRISAQQRVQMLTEYDRSGMSAAEFAKCCGLKYTTLCGWLQRRQNGESQKDRKSDGMRWVEAVVAVPGRVGSSSRVVIHLAGGVRVEAVDAPVAVEVLKGLGVKAC